MSGVTRTSNVGNGGGADLQNFSPSHSMLGTAMTFPPRDCNDWISLLKAKKYETFSVVTAPPKAARAEGKSVLLSNTAAADGSLDDPTVATDCLQQC